MALDIHAWLANAVVRHNLDHGAEYQKPRKGHYVQLIAFHTHRDEANPHRQIVGEVADTKHRVKVIFDVEATDDFEASQHGVSGESLTSHLRHIFRLTRFSFDLAPPKPQKRERERHRDRSRAASRPLQPRRGLSRTASILSLLSTSVADDDGELGPDAGADAEAEPEIELPEVCLRVHEWVVCGGGSREQPVYWSQTVKLGRGAGDGEVQKVLRKWWFGETYSEPAASREQPVAGPSRISTSGSSSRTSASSAEPIPLATFLRPFLQPPPGKQPKALPDWLFEVSESDRRQLDAIKVFGVDVATSAASSSSIRSRPAASQSNGGAAALGGEAADTGVDIDAAWAAHASGTSRPSSQASSTSGGVSRVRGVQQLLQSPLRKGTFASKTPTRLHSARSRDASRSPSIPRPTPGPATRTPTRPRDSGSEGNEEELEWSLSPEVVQRKRDSESVRTPARTRSPSSRTPAAFSAVQAEDESIDVPIPGRGPTPSASQFGTDLNSSNKRRRRHGQVETPPVTFYPSPTRGADSPPPAVLRSLHVSGEVDDSHEEADDAEVGLGRASQASRASTAHSSGGMRIRMPLRRPTQLRAGDTSRRDRFGGLDSMLAPTSSPRGSSFPNGQTEGRVGEEEEEDEYRSSGATQVPPPGQRLVRTPREVADEEEDEEDEEDEADVVGVSAGRESGSARAAQRSGDRRVKRARKQLHARSPLWSSSSEGGALSGESSPGTANGNRSANGANVDSILPRHRRRKQVEPMSGSQPTSRPNGSGPAATLFDRSGPKSVKPSTDSTRLALSPSAACRSQAGPGLVRGSGSGSGSYSGSGSGRTVAGGSASAQIESEVQEAQRPIPGRGQSTSWIDMHGYGYGYGSGATGAKGAGVREPSESLSQSVQSAGGMSLSRYAGDKDEGDGAARSRTTGAGGEDDQGSEEEEEEEEELEDESWRSRNGLSNGTGTAGDRGRSEAGYVLVEDSEESATRVAATTAEVVSQLSTFGRASNGTARGELSGGQGVPDRISQGAHGSRVVGTLSGDTGRELRDGVGTSDEVRIEHGATLEVRHAAGVRFAGVGKVGGEERRDREDGDAIVVVDSDEEEEEVEEKEMEQEEEEEVEEVEQVERIEVRGVPSRSRPISTTTTTTTTTGSRTDKPATQSSLAHTQATGMSLDKGVSAAVRALGPASSLAISEVSILLADVDHGADAQDNGDGDDASGPTRKSGIEPAVPTTTAGRRREREREEAPHARSAESSQRAVKRVKIEAVSPVRDEVHTDRKDRHRSGSSMSGGTGRSGSRAGSAAARNEHKVPLKLDGFVLDLTIPLGLDPMWVEKEVRRAEVTRARAQAQAQARM